jgi:hypothetical protein
MDSGNTAVERHVTISEVADAEHRGLEPRATQFAARSKCAAPVGSVFICSFHYWFSAPDDGITAYHKRGKISQFQPHMPKRLPHLANLGYEIVHDLQFPNEAARAIVSVVTECSIIMMIIR